MRRPLRVGLTGSIGMGKTTTAALFAEAGLPVWDADAAVHRLYAPGGAAVGPVGAAFPEAVAGGAIDRTMLKRCLAADPGALRRLEAIVHPLVAEDRRAFLAAVDAKADARAVILDVPLLFETGLDREMDLAVVVTTDAATQCARVMARPGMTEARFRAMLAAQMPDADKRARADMCVRSDDMATARGDVAAVLDRLEEMHA